MKTSLQSIETFLAGKKIAVAGVSRDQKKFGHVIYKELKEKGFEVYPVNPGTDMINGDPCFRSVGVLPVNVKHLLIVTPKNQTRDIVAETVAKGIDHIWIQQMSDTREAIDLAVSHQVNLVTGQCILMHTDPVKGVHKFHRTLMKFFGRFPK
jgi:predicted CoA-binding protein